MSFIYLVIKYIHIFSAIVAVGSNITYGVWSQRAQAEPSNFAFVFKGIQFIDNRLANPAYGVLFLTGLIMVFAGNWGFKFWVIAAIVLFVAVAVIGFGFFTPLLRNQIRLAEAGETSSPEFVRGLRRNQIIGPVLGLLVAIIIVMMVFKPTL